MNGYRVTVQTKDGKEQSFFTKRMSDIKTKSAVLGGLMTSSEEVAKAVSNPTKIRRMKNSADRYFKKNPTKSKRKRNPTSVKMGRVKGAAGDIKSLASLYSIPADPREAYKLGFYFGIIRGIDTCGVQNYFERKRIRQKFGEKLVSGAFEVASKAAGVGGGSTRSSRRGYRPDEDDEDYGTPADMDDEFDFEDDE
jgi:hypothetical protein